VSSSQSSAQTGSSVSTAAINQLLRADHRRKKRHAVYEKFVTRLIASILAAFIGGWQLMLGVGIIHAEWIHGLPTIGYWLATALVALLRGTFSTIRPSDKGSES